MALPDAASTGRVSLRVGAAQDRDRPAATVVCVLAVPAGDDPEVQEGDDPEVPAGDDPEVQEGDDPEVQEGDDPEVPEGDDPEVPAGDDPEVPADPAQGCRGADRRRGGGAGDGSEAICSQSTWRVTHVLMRLRPREL